MEGSQRNPVMTAPSVYWLKRLNPFDSDTQRMDSVVGFFTASMRMNKFTLSLTAGSRPGLVQRYHGRLLPHTADTMRGSDNTHIRIRSEACDQRYDDWQSAREREHGPYP